MRELISLISLVFACYTLGAQSLSPEVVATTGETFSNANISMEWTVGELSTETYAGTIVLTQGFHQPTVRGTNIKDFGDRFGEIKVFPNPTSGGLTIKREKAGDLQLVLWDMKGSVVMQESMSALVHSMDLSHLSEGIYVLRMSDGKTNARSIRIEKL